MNSNILGKWSWCSSSGVHCILSIQCALDCTWANSTFRKYSSALNQFINFCDLKGIPPLLRIPTSEHLLCAFTASRISSIAGSTAKPHIAMIKAWHIYNNALWSGGPHLHYILNGVSNLAPSSPHCPLHPPITCELLLLLNSHLSHSDPFNDCCWAAANCTMWGQACLGEIVSCWELSFNVAHVPCMSNLSPPLNSCSSHCLFLHQDHQIHRSNLSYHLPSLHQPNSLSLCPLFLFIPLQCLLSHQM
ncbi:hypothetical protein PAXRUDRAFT_177709 [Paxillus rubicundulus Ve08.2h10]|uniref:Uncharacterized protein n=1 Tax=Paxillus rubicundulus Ve08.2h10 TaxID=930991 RepID=A0A0D0CS47_9AGAM|nr:hypothetical protein PAXRUDRAFT_177709 [Paxillus rubicundulus Ve08.2h10]